MRNFNLYGEILGSEDDRTAYEQVTPTQFNQFIDKLDDGEELQISFNSVGGDVFAGIAIANTIRRISAEGHKVTAIIEGLAASIASVIMCACDKVIMSESSLVMIHNCWTVVQGDSKTLRKEADAMDKFNAAILSFYKNKFDVPEETIKKWMDAETWFSGKEAADFHFDCEVIADADDFNIAAKLKGADLSKFAHAPKALKDIKMEDKENEKQADVVEVEPEAVEVVAEETPVEVKAEEPVAEEKTTVEAPESEPKAEVILPVETPEPEKTVTLAECEMRIKGMQSKMGKQLDFLRKEYDAKILDFTNQLKLKDDELMEAKASITSITAELEKAKRELQETASALEQKTSALAKLNASVLSPSVSDGDGWRKLKGKAFFEWLKNHPEAR